MRWIDRGPEPLEVSCYKRYTKRWIEHFPANNNCRGVGERPSDHYWGRFRPILAERSNEICWYCELKCDTGARETGVDTIEGNSLYSFYKESDDNSEAFYRSPTVDHFRPLSCFPHLAYEWSNWVFSCSRCNTKHKQNKWPDVGYVDPCAPEPDERPERYVDYKSVTGEITPRTGLSETARQRAIQTIEDLGLNALDVMYYCLQWTSTQSTLESKG